MAITKIHLITIIAASGIIATATTLTGFPGATPVLATPITLGTTEQVSNNTDDTNTTTITSPTITGQEQQEQPIHITKDSTTSYVIAGGSSSVGSFDTTYRIAGESIAVRASEGLITSTITSDYSSSPTIGYVIIGNNTTTTTTAASAGADASNSAATLPNSFATDEQISEKITSELRRVIGEADGKNANNNMTTLQEGGQQQQPMMEIKCVFGMEIDDMRCDNYIPSAEGMGEAAELTPGAPLENDEFETDSNIS